MAILRLGLKSDRPSSYIKNKMKKFLTALLDDLAPFVKVAERDHIYLFEDQEPSSRNVIKNKPNIQKSIKPML